MKMISLRKNEEGYWLRVNTNDAKSASILIENLGHGHYVNSVFLQWAKEEFERQSKLLQEQKK